MKKKTKKLQRTVPPFRQIAVVNKESADLVYALDAEGRVWVSIVIVTPKTLNVCGWRVLPGLGMPL